MSRSDNANSQPPCTLPVASRLGIHSPSPMQRIYPGWAGAQCLELWVKRDDLLHPVISGNKWRKLKYALTPLLGGGVERVISFGGGFSNHLHALGYCCRQLGIAFEARIRGNYQQTPTPMLQDLLAWGAHIRYLSKAEYRMQADLAASQPTSVSSGGVITIPEGGSQQQALPGVAEILRELPQDLDYILLPVGSGGTLAGLVGARPMAKVVGVAVLKGEGYLEALVNRLTPGTGQTHWQILHHYHGGGYAKVPPALAAFCRQCEQETGIPLEPVYSGKLFYAVKDLVEKGYFAAGSRLLLLHTGGLQGARTSG